MTIFSNSPKPTASPWGEPDRCEEVAPGIWWVSTPGHGGYLISRQRLIAMPDDLKINRYGHGDQCAFEEDLEWSLVVAAWPSEFTGKDQNNARACLRFWARMCPGNVDVTAAALRYAPLAYCGAGMASFVDPSGSLQRAGLLVVQS